MKIRNVVILVVILGMLCIFNKSKAYTISMEDINTKRGQEFTVKMHVDKYTSIANGDISYDSKKLEFVGTVTKGLEAKKCENGNISWYYINEKYWETTASKENEMDYGVQDFEFIFQVVNTGSSKISFSNLAFICVDGSEIDKSVYQGKTDCEVKTENVTMGIVCISLLLLIIIISTIGAVIRKKMLKNKVENNA